MIFALRCGGQDRIRRSYEYDQRQTHRQCLEDFDMPHADIKCTTDLEIDVRALMLDIEKIILQLDPSSGVCKGRLIRIDEYHYSHLNIELRMFATKERDVEFSSQLVSRVDKKAKSLMKSAAHVTVKLEFSPVTYLTGFHDPRITDK